ncbi:MAG: hypothetical protein SOZ73_06540 [Campylobacter sp.]|nr:hypothetical protein [Campylobacter sp.]
MSKRYILYSVAYIALVAAIAFYFSSQNFTIQAFGYELTLPVAAWCVLPVAIFALLSVLHMMFYGFKQYLDSRALRSDMESFESFAKESFLGLESNKEFKTPLYTSAVSVLRALNPLNSFGSPSFKNEGLQAAYETFTKVRNGEVVELKSLRLPKTNALFIQNEINKAKTDVKHALSLLSSKDELPSALLDAAKKNAVANADYNILSKTRVKFDFNDICVLLERLGQKQIQIAGDELLSLLKTEGLSSENYLRFAKILKKRISPDMLINIFKKLRLELPIASEACFYLLYDLQMIDELRELLNACEGERFERIEVLLFLRDHGKMEKADLIYNL